jgi:S1-C subfamily serine protease
MVGGMNLADVLLVLAVVVFAALGAYRGFALQALALGGLAVGALVGSFVAPVLLPDNSPWTPVASLVGAACGALVLGTLAASLGRPIARFFAARPGLAVVDRLGGIAVGALLGLAFVWLVAVLALQQPALGLRKEVRESAFLPRLVDAVPPATVLRALNRFDPLPLLPGTTGGLPAPDPSVLQSPGPRAASGGVVKIHGSSCGVGTQGSGWVVRRGLVATNAHVIAGQQGTEVLAPNGQALSARPVYVDSANDVALLRVAGLRAPRLRTDDRDRFPLDVALLGYPRNGPLTAVAGTAGQPRTVLAPDAYRDGIGPRAVVPLRGGVQPGDSGGPVVDRSGRVVAMIFAGTRAGDGGYAVPLELVLRALSTRLRPVSPGPCLG